MMYLLALSFGSCLHCVMLFFSCCNERARIDAIVSINVKSFAKIKQLIFEVATRPLYVRLNYGTEKMTLELSTDKRVDLFIRFDTSPRIPKCL